MEVAAILLFAVVFFSLLGAGVGAILPVAVLGVVDRPCRGDGGFRRSGREADAHEDGRHGRQSDQEFSQAVHHDTNHRLE